jgi:thioredoxin-dependent peroxiredoxin
MALAIGKVAPSFSLSADDGSVVTLEELRGKPVVLYFYPKDDTPGCTKEACSFRDEFPRFRTSKATIAGVSPDSVASHAKFRKKYKLPFMLLSDPDHAVAELYGVWGKKKLFGASYMGILRTTFIIDADGILKHIIPVKRVEGHSEQVLELLNAL